MIQTIFKKMLESGILLWWKDSSIIDKANLILILSVTSSLPYGKGEVSESVNAIVTHLKNNKVIKYYVNE